MVPNREKGTEKVAMFGVMLRMTIRSAGFEGINFDDMLALGVVVENRWFLGRYTLRLGMVRAGVDVCM